jgi:hypothetical protein
MQLTHQLMKDFDVLMIKEIIIEKELLVLIHDENFMIS